LLTHIGKRAIFVPASTSSYTNDSPHVRLKVDSIDFTSPRERCQILRLACLFVSLFVCSLVYLENHTTELPPNFPFILSVVVARSSSHGVAICYVLPVLWMTNCFSHSGPYGASCVRLELDQCAT